MEIRSTLPISLGLALALSTPGGVAGAASQRPDLALAGAYQAAVSLTQGAAPPPEIETWWRGFGDPLLVQVVERAQAENLDIAEARARVLQSRAAAQAAGAALWPAVALNGEGRTQRQSLQGPIGTIGRHLPGFTRDDSVEDLGLGVFLDPDLFGGLRHGREAARADARAEAARAAAVRLTIIAETADAYIEARAFQARLAVARRQAAIQTDLVDLLRRQAAQGVASERELRQTEAALEGVRATLPPLATGLEAALNRLDVLMGSRPGTWRGMLQGDGVVPTPPGLALGDGPAELLRRRPDIVAAEERLIAAHARIGQNLAEYYPKVSLSGLLGVESLDAAKLASPDALQASAAGAFRWRLFDFGRVDAAVAGARAVDAEALAAWRGAALRATEEVENAVTDLAQKRARADFLDRQITQLTLARRQAEQAYAEGALSLVEVREADRELLAATDQLTQAHAGAALATVAAYTALGGGWTPPSAAGS